MKTRTERETHRRLLVNAEELLRLAKLVAIQYNPNRTLEELEASDDLCELITEIENKAEWVEEVKK